MIRNHWPLLVALEEATVRARSFAVSLPGRQPPHTVAMLGRAAGKTVLAILIAPLLCTLPCSGQSVLVEGDYSHQILRLEGGETVKTWEHEGVRVFLAEEGAIVRQGPVRLAAPRMVVWFDKALSSSPDVRAAVVRVYAEGAESEDGTGRTPVRLVEGKGVRECGAIFMRFTSTVSFVWDCPLIKSEKPIPSTFLARAESLTSGLEEETCWEEMPAPGPIEVIEVVARHFMAKESHIFFEEEPLTFVWIGDVHGYVGNLEVRADVAVLWYDQRRDAYEVYAQGNVRLGKRPGAVTPPEERTEGRPGIAEILQSLRADEIYVNAKTARGLATNTELRLKDPTAPQETVYVFRGDEAYLIDSKTLIIKEVSATTCRFARPHYQFKAEQVQVVRERPSTLLSARNTRLQVGEAQRTLLWLPFVGIDLTRRAYLLSDYAVGSSTKFGTFVQTTWQPLDVTTPPPWVDSWTVNLDYYSARGPGIGSELRYEFGEEPYPRHEGRIRAYYIRDSGKTDDTELPVPQDARGRFHVEHRSQLNRDWRVDAEYYKLSDEGFLSEYFEADFEGDKTPESYLLARYLRNSTYLALLYKQRVNDFLTQVEETPSADLEIVGLPFGRFVYEGSVEAGHYDLEFSDLLPAALPEPSGLFRFHTDHKLSLPFSVGIFRLDPFLRALATWTDKSAPVGGSFRGSESRSGVGAGITASTTFSRSFGLASELFDLNRLRHIIIPYVGIETLSVSGGESARFIQMDRVDAIDSGTQVTLGVRQRVQTKRRRQGRWRSINWVELDVAYVSRSSDSVLTSLDGDYVRADFEMLLSDHVSLHSRDNWFGSGSQPDVINLGARFDYLPQWALDVDYDRISDLCSALTLDLTYQLSDRYRLLLTERYEFDSRGTGEEKNLETQLIIRRLLHEWVLDVGLRIDRANDDFAVVFGFGPAGWGFYRDVHRAGR